MRLEAKDFIILIAGALTGAVLGCMLAIIIIKKVLPAPQIATVDIQALIARASGRLSLKDVPEEELKGQANAFTDQLKTEIQALATQKKLIILKAQGVLEGAPDITDLIEEALNQEDRQ